MGRSRSGRLRKRSRTSEISVWMMRSMRVRMNYQPEASDARNEGHGKVEEDSRGCESRKETEEEHGIGVTGMTPGYRRQTRDQ
jgi:hypothetical protein